MTITIVGHGYVGLVTAAVFADLGNTVWVIGRTKEKIEKLKKGTIPFFEPGLTELVQNNINAGRLLFTMDYKDAVSASSIIIICVGTPAQSNGEADLRNVYDTTEKIAKVISGYKVIVTKSTVPPGTNREISRIITEQKSEGASFSIASVPEFLREGTAIDDSLHPDRIVIGTTSNRARELLRELHKPIDGKFLDCNVETAELIKYTSNSFLSTKISFANSIAILSEKIGADVKQVLDGVGLDRRIGRSFLYPGVGYGGSCFPKDVKALIAIAQKHGFNFSILRAVEELNNKAITGFTDKILRHFDAKLENKKIAILGLAFKPNTDDMRDAPSICIIKTLCSQRALIVAYDPKAMENAKHLLPKDVTFAQSAYEAAEGADAVVVLTEWNEFRQLDLVQLAKRLRNLVLFDGRNIYEPSRVKQLGFVYYGVGRM